MSKVYLWESLGEREDNLRPGILMLEVFREMMMNWVCSKRQKIRTSRSKRD